MEEETIKKYRKAGRIASEALHYGKDLIRKGESLLEVTNKIESKVKELGGSLAFPSQMSLNETAAHNYPSGKDEIVFEDELVCLDVGVHVDGFVGDNALTVDLSGKNSELVEASREALNEVLKMIQIGTELREIGKTVNEVITSFGFKPVRNLSGHGLGEYDVHTKPTIPNYDNDDSTKLEKGMVIAIEPFASAGAGMVEERGDAQVFSQIQKKPVRVGFVRKILDQISDYRMLPFARSWLEKNFSEAQVKYALNKLEQLDIVKSHPPLVDRNDGLVSQAEHTVLIDDKVEVLTKSG